MHVSTKTESYGESAPLVGNIFCVDSDEISFNDLEERINKGETATVAALFYIFYPRNYTHLLLDECDFMLRKFGEEG